MPETMIGSLCTGYGGLDMALLRALGGDARVAWHVDNADGPQRILRHHHPDVPLYGDLKTLDLDHMPRVTWLTAGYPCQPFSTAGRQLGEADERHLWPYVALAVSRLRPRHVLLENVANHLRLGFQRVLADLAALGYDARWGLVRASDAGAPHLRERLFVVADDADPTGERRRRSAWEQRRLGSAGLLPHPARIGRGRPDDDRAQGPDADTDDPQLAGQRAQQPGRGAAARSGEATAADPDGRGRDGRSPDAQRGKAGRAAPAGRGPVDDAAPDAGDGPGQRERSRPEPRPRSEVNWQEYEPAIRTWERVTGRDAPRPTEPGGRGSERLSPRFVEWMQGLPDGWVTGVPGLNRPEQLRALGNGVVPQQAHLALTLLGVVDQRLEEVA